MPSPRDLHPLSFKPSQKQWDECLGGLKRRTRAAYCKKAVEAYMAAFPVVRSIPLDEPPDEPMSAAIVNFSGNGEILAWLHQFPPLFRSYVVRIALNWYRRQYPPGGAVMQPTLLDELESATGS